MSSRTIAALAATALLATGVSVAVMTTAIRLVLVFLAFGMVAVQ